MVRWPPPCTFRSRRKGSALLASMVMLLAVLPGTATASSPVISDCNSHGRLTQHYTIAQLRGALATMPADIQEYTDCYDVIERQLLAQISSVHGAARPASQASSFLPTPLIVVLAVLVLAGAAFGVIALRR